MCEISRQMPRTQSVHRSLNASLPSHFLGSSNVSSFALVISASTAFWLPKSRVSHDGLMYCAADVSKKGCAKHGRAEGNEGSVARADGRC